MPAGFYVRNVWKADKDRACRLIGQRPDRHSDGLGIGPFPTRDVAERHVRTLRFAHIPAVLEERAGNGHGPLSRVP